VQQQCEVPVDRLLCGVARMDDEQAHHAAGQLHHLVGVRVVHVRAVLTQRELVGPGFAGLDMRLRESPDAIHAIGQQDAVPVDAGVLRQPVGHQDAHAVALHCLDGRAGSAAVVTPGPDLRARRKFMFQLPGDQLELLHTIDHAVRQAAAIERSDGSLPPRATDGRCATGTGAPAGPASGAAPAAASNSRREIFMAGSPLQHAQMPVRSPAGRRQRG
jgi:hypothetical protein